MTDRLSALAGYHAALTDALPLAGSRSLADGPTAAELALEADYGHEVRPALSELYVLPVADGLDALLGLSEAEIVRWVLDYYGDHPQPVERLGAAYRSFGRRAFNLGGQMGLNDLGLLGYFEATDPTMLAAVDEPAARLTDTRRRAGRSTVVTTAEEIAGEVARRRDAARQRDEGLTAADLLPLLSTWALGRTVIRSGNIAATESVRMSRWGMVWAFAGNGIRGVRHLCEPDVLDKCRGAICPPLCGTEYELRGVFDPMAGIPTAATIPLHPRCRCSWEPLTDGWLKPALIWTGFALDALSDSAWGNANNG